MAAPGLPHLNQIAHFIVQMLISVNINACAFSAKKLQP